MRENRTYGSVRGGGSNADRLLDCDMSASWGLPGAMLAASLFRLSFSRSTFVILARHYRQNCPAILRQNSSAVTSGASSWKLSGGTDRQIYQAFFLRTNQDRRLGTGHRGGFWIALNSHCDNPQEQRTGVFGSLLSWVRRLCFLEFCRAVRGRPLRVLCCSVSSKESGCFYFLQSAYEFQIPTAISRNNQ